MKNAIILSSIVFILMACKKVHPVPEEYLGTWKAEAAQMISTEDRIYTLTITPDKKGGADGHYISDGAMEILNADKEGKVRIENNTLYVGSADFQISEAPNENEDGDIEMKLGSIIFTKE